MQPFMTAGETSLLDSFLKCAEHYVEFGAGGSTCFASRRVKASVTAVDSSREWLDKVASFCAETTTPVQPRLVLADIGPTGDWGFPADESHIASWPDYHEAVWKHPAAKDSDFFLVDGRFRMACFMQILLRCRPDALIAIHDFSTRPQYHIVNEFARRVAWERDLSIFLPRPDRSESQVRALLEQFRLDPA